jgi:hypothetical protein
MFLITEIPHEIAQNEKSFSAAGAGTSWVDGGIGPGATETDCFQLQASQFSGGAEFMPAGI